MIDHHAVGEPFADGYIIPEASSAAEALYDVALVLESMGKIKINEALAYALYTAISSDTGCFAYSNAKPKTHRVAARLMELNIDTADIKPENNYLPIYLTDYPNNTKIISIEPKEVEYIIIEKNEN
jgi:phosphoesterase RecJ-like protein